MSTDFTKALMNAQPSWMTEDAVASAKSLPGQMLESDAADVRADVSGGGANSLAVEQMIVRMSEPKRRNKAPTIEPVYRPFQLVQVADTKVQIVAGEVHWLGSWVVPTWVGTGAFGTDYTVSSTKTLQLRADVMVDEEEITADAIKIGWDIAATYEGLPERTYAFKMNTAEPPEIEMTEAHTDGQIVLDVVNVTFGGGEITGFTQYIDYNVVLPWNLDIDTTVFVEGGSTSSA